MINNKIEWKIPDKKYLDYLRNDFDKRIPNYDYGENKYKPFFGSLFSIGDMIYMSQISHAQPRHMRMKENKDFYKIYHPQKNILLAVVNLNFMFPVHKSLFYDFEYKNIDQYINFNNSVERSKYINLLKLELKQMNLKPLSQSAKDIYTNKYLYPDNKLSARCLDFKSLEHACKLYIE